MRKIIPYVLFFSLFFIGSLFLEADRADALAPSSEGEMLLPLNSLQNAPISALKIALYRPLNCRIRGDILLFSGMNRNYQEYRDAMEPIAQHLCLRLYSPYFDKEHFPPKDYQRGGRGLEIIPILIAALRKQDGTHIPYFMIGHSAGAQFLERIAAYAAPQNIQKFIIISPSSYVLPSLENEEPYGFKDHSPQEIATYLQEPLTILVGGKERGETAHLLKNKEAMMQGLNRLERAEKTFFMAQEISQKMDISLKWSFHKLPHLGHDFKKMLQSPSLKEVLQESLLSFEKSPI